MDLISIIIVKQSCFQIQLPCVDSLRKINQSQGKQSPEASNQNQNFDDTKSIIFQKTVKMSVGEIKNLWSIKLQREFIQVYKTNQYFLHIKAHFIEKYPEHKQLFQGNSLKNRLFQILRASMRKVREIALKSKKMDPDLVKMDDDKIKYVLKSSRALQARLMLVDIYLDDNRSFTERIEAVVNQINTALQDRDPDRSVCSFSSFTSGQLTHEEIVAARKERKKQRRLQLIKQKKQREEKRLQAIKLNPPNIKLEPKPVTYEDYKRYLKYECKEEVNLEQLQDDKYHYNISKKLQDDPQRYERQMQDQNSDYPSMYYYSHK